MGTAAHRLVVECQAYCKIKARCSMLRVQGQKSNKKKKKTEKETNGICIIYIVLYFWNVNAWITA